MKQTITLGTQKVSKFFKLSITTALFVAMLGLTSRSLATTQVGYQAESWNSQQNKITRSGQTLATSLPSVLPDYAEGLDFQYILDNEYTNSRALTSSAVGNPQIYQHIYGYSETTSTAAYTTSNQTGHKITSVVSANDIYNLLQKTVKVGQAVRITNNLKLDGELILAKPSDVVKGFKGLLASFDVLVTKETEGTNGKIKTSKVFKGSVQLIGKKNGKVTIKTTGGIKKKYISSVEVTDENIVVSFDDVLVPYKTKVLVGQEYTLNTHISSNIVTTGSGTGAEVNFGPDVSVVPSYQENGIPEVPEPLTLMLLMGGLMQIVSRKRGTKAIKVTA